MSLRSSFSQLINKLRHPPTHKTPDEHVKTARQQGSGILRTIKNWLTPNSHVKQSFLASTHLKDDLKSVAKGLSSRSVKKMGEDIKARMTPSPDKKPDSSGWAAIHKNEWAEGYKGGNDQKAMLDAEIAHLESTMDELKHHSSEVRRENIHYNKMDRMLDRGGSEVHNILMKMPKLEARLNELQQLQATAGRPSIKSNEVIDREIDDLIRKAEREDAHQEQILENETNYTAIERMEGKPSDDVIQSSVNAHLYRSQAHALEELKNKYLRSSAGWMPKPPTDTK